MNENFSDCGWTVEMRYGRLHYNKESQGFEILKDRAVFEHDRDTGECYVSNWETDVHKSLSCGEWLEVCVSGVWTQARLVRCRGGWCLAGIPYRGRLDNIAVRWQEFVPAYTLTAREY